MGWFFFSSTKTKTEVCPVCKGKGSLTSETDGLDYPCSACGGHEEDRSSHFARRTLYFKGSGKQRVTYDKAGQVVEREPHGKPQRWYVS